MTGSAATGTDDRAWPICCGGRRESPVTRVLSCPAKLNVFLEVHGRRPDGFHELETVMLRVSLEDTLKVSLNASGELTLRFSDATPEHIRAGVPLDHRNLILKAAEGLRVHAGVSAGADFVLHKRIPPESGLAGGSSNAAATLRGCRDLWNLPVSDAELHEIAAALGSDINFLLSGVAAAVCRGRGEQVNPVTLNRRLHFAAVRPKSGNSTAAVFRTTTLPDVVHTSHEIVRFLENPDGPLNPGCLVNRLTDAAKRLNPEMSDLMKRLEQLTCQPVFMSGSGSTVFVIARDACEALRLRHLIEHQIRLPAWQLACEPDRTRLRQNSGAVH